MRTYNITITYIQMSVILLWDGGRHPLGVRDSIEAKLGSRSSALALWREVARLGAAWGGGDSLEEGAISEGQWWSGGARSPSRSPCGSGETIYTHDAKFKVKWEYTWDFFCLEHAWELRIIIIKSTHENCDLTKKTCALTFWHFQVTWPMTSLKTVLFYNLT